MPTDAATNLFVHRSAAQRYAAARPYFHPQVVADIAAFTGMSRFDHALDVACGTGQSSRALAAIARMVDAIDVSPEMVAEAEAAEGVRYQVSPAESMPFADSTFDLATVGLAFHWLDQLAFLAEARRVLRPGGWLVVYNSGFNGEMAENPAFRSWAWEAYPQRFPSVPRRSFDLTADTLGPLGFDLRGKASFAHNETMTPEQLTGYLLTQTNVIAAVEGDSVPVEDAAAWIEAGVRPFFTGPTGTMRFGGAIWYLRRPDATETGGSSSVHRPP